jgi:signal transduction histidine kinase
MNAIPAVRRDVDATRSRGHAVGRMNWITAIWYAGMGACLILALMHLLVWRRDGRSLPNLVFPVIAFGIIALGACELALMRSTSPPAALGIVRLGHLLFGIVVPASLLFVHFLFGTGRTWLLLVAIGLRTAAVIANFTTGASLHFLSIETLGQVSFIGETVSVIGEAVENPWVRLGQLAAIAQIAYVADASLRLWGKGGEINRRRAAAIGGSTVLLFLVAMAVTGLISSGRLRAPMLVSFPFFGMVLAISYEMSRELRRTARLAVALETSERRLSLAGSAGRLAFWEWDPAGDGFWISEDGWEIFGIAPTASLGLGEFLGHVHEADRGRVAGLVAASAAGTGGFSAEFRIGPAAEARWISASGGGGKNPAGGASLVRGIAIDVTANKEAEAEAARQRSELALLSRVSTLGALSGSLAHELNQPLTAILGNAQAGRRCLASATPDLAETADILDDIIADTKRAGGIIHGMRALFSRETAPELVPVDLNAAVRDSLSLIRSEVVARKGRVDFTPASPPPRVLARVVEVQQVLINLVLNGLDALPPARAGERPGKPRVRIRIEVAGPDVLVEVSDNGPGIPEEFRARLFEPFFSSKSDRGGLGLGLSISRGLVERFGGSLDALPGEPGTGAVFRIRLPALPEVEKACVPPPKRSKVAADPK